MAAFLFAKVCIIATLQLPACNEKINQIHSVHRMRQKEHFQQSAKTVTYSDRFPAKVLLESAILKLDYGIDLSHLKLNKFVPK
jgi:hypothetical protein